MRNKQDSSNTTRNAQNANSKQSETQNKTTSGKGGCGCKKSSNTKNCG